MAASHILRRGMNAAMSAHSTMMGNGEFDNGGDAPAQVSGVAALIFFLSFSVLIFFVFSVRRPSCIIIHGH
jgi:hypothetical protein